MGNGKSTTHILFSFEKHIKEKNTLTGSEVSKLLYTMTRKPLHSIYFPYDYCRQDNAVKFTVFKTLFSFLRLYLDYVVYFEYCCGSSPIPSGASNQSPGSPSLPTSAPASPQSSSAAPPGRPEEWHCKTQGSQTAIKLF